MSIKKHTTFLKLISIGLLTLLVGCTKVESLPKVESSNETQSNLAEIHFIDTGNSDSILIKEGQKAMLIDGADNDDEKLSLIHI